MNSELKYQLYESRWAVLIYYTVVVLITIFLGGGGGREMTSAIFLFVVGLNSFKSTFYFFLANGRSRKRLFTSTVKSTLILCAGMAVVDLLFSMLCYYVDQNNLMIFGALYAPYAEGVMTTRVWLESLPWTMLLYCAACLLGLVITLLYYRMNKEGRIAVSVGVPVLLFAIYPYVDARFFNMRITNGLMDFTGKIMGTGNGSINPYLGMLTLAILSLILASIVYLLMRRTVLKGK